jgi:uncharacterized membrane protein
VHLVQEVFDIWIFFACGLSEANCLRFDYGRGSRTTRGIPMVIIPVVRVEEGWFTFALTLRRSPVVFWLSIVAGLGRIIITLAFTAVRLSASLRVSRITRIEGVGLAFAFTLPAVRSSITS